MSADTITARASLLQGVLVAIFVPLTVLGLLEFGCRLFSLDKRLAPPAAAPQLLDMPTWMLREDNVRARLSVQKAVDEDALAWMSLFQEGDGFRVNLIPSTERLIRNTFSRLPSDQDQRYLVRTNKLGFRGPDLATAKSPGTYRILVFGDSSSFGWGVNQDEMYSELLRQSLQQRAPSGTTIEVGNFAIPGDSSEYGKLLFEKFAAKYSPDLILLGFGANDSKKVVTPHRSQVERFHQSEGLLTLRVFLNHSALVRTLAGVLTPRPPNIAPDSLPPLAVAVSRKRYQSNLADMGLSAQKQGATTVLLTLCTPLQYRRAAEKVASNRNFLFVDGQQLLLKSIPALAEGKIYPEEVSVLKKSLGNTLSGNSLFYVSSDGCHPNRVGHRIVADALTNTIAPLLTGKTP